MLAWSVANNGPKDGKGRDVKGRFVPGHPGNPKGRAGRTDSAKRRDGWSNFFTGQGILGRDKRMSSVFSADMLSFDQLTMLWRGDDLAARAVETFPREAMRQGYDLIIAEDQEGQETDTSARTAEIEDKLEKLGVDKYLKIALNYERGFGGGAILLGVNDGQEDLTQPLNLNKVRSIDWLTELEPREIQPIYGYTDPRAPKYGQPEIYRMVSRAVLPSSGGTSAPGSVDIHESRLLVFNGIRVSRYQVASTQGGWGDSILNRMWRVLRDFNTVWSSAGVLVTDFSQAVYKMKDLWETLSADNQSAFAERLQAMDLGRSTINSIVIDSEDEFQRQSTPITGLPDLLDKFTVRLAAAADMPITLLFGVSPAGLNATGESDIRLFYDRVASYQRDLIAPQLRQLIQIIMRTTGDRQEPKKWSLRFRPLWQESAADRAKAMLTVAQADSTWIGAGVYSPEEAADAHWGTGEWNPEISIDFRAREKQEKVQEAPVGMAPEDQDAIDPNDPTPPTGPKKPDEPPETVGAGSAAKSPDVNSEPKPIVNTEDSAASVRMDFVEKRGSKWVVLNHTKEKVLGTYESKEEAVKRLQQIEWFKHHGDHYDRARNRRKKQSDARRRRERERDAAGDQYGDPYTPPPGPGTAKSRPDVPPPHYGAAPDPNTPPQPVEQFSEDANGEVTKRKTPRPAGKKAQPRPELGLHSDALGVPYFDGGDWDESKHPRGEGGRFGEGAEAAELLETATRQQGFTFDPRANKHADSGYSVAIYPDRTVKIKGELTTDHLLDFARTNHDVLSRDEHAQLGGWYDTKEKEWVLDVIHVEHHVENAVALGQKHAQDAIYDLKRHEEIRNHEYEDAAARRGRFAGRTDAAQPSTGRGVRSSRDDQRGIGGRGQEDERPRPEDERRVDAWSEEAREAAAEARKAGAKGKSPDARKSAVKEHAKKIATKRAKAAEGEKKPEQGKAPPAPKKPPEPKKPPGGGGGGGGQEGGAAPAAHEPKSPAHAPAHGEAPHEKPESTGEKKKAPAHEKAHGHENEGESSEGKHGGEHKPGEGDKPEHKPGHEPEHESHEKGPESLAPKLADITSEYATGKGVKEIITGKKGELGGGGGEGPHGPAAHEGRAGHAPKGGHEKASKVSKAPKGKHEKPGHVSKVPKGKHDAGEFEESKHPRDPHGRFGTGTGEPSAGTTQPKEAPSTAKTPHTPMPKEAGHQLAAEASAHEGGHHPSPVASSEEERQGNQSWKGAAAGARDTEEAYKHDGQWDPARAAMHEDYIQSRLEGVPQNPAGVTVYMTGGGPAAGKTTGLLKNPETHIPDRTQAAHVDADSAKGDGVSPNDKWQGLPEFRAGVEAKDPAAAAFVHEESAAMSKTGVDRAIRTGRDVVYDSTGDGGIDNLTKKVDAMRAAGAKRVVANYATLDIDEAVKRSDARAARSGRFVPHDVIRGIHHDVAKTASEAMKRGLFDECNVWDTTSKTPRLIASYTRQRGMQIHDQELWSKFLSRGQN